MADENDLNGAVANNLLDEVKALRREVENLKRRPVEATEASEIVDSLGVLSEGEFRSYADPQNPVEPGDGFSGVRICGGGVEYGGERYMIVGADNDQLMFGFRTTDGLGLFAGGNAKIGLTGIEMLGLNYLIKHTATNAGETRVGKLMMTLPDGSTVPIYALDFTSEAGPELMTNGDFESGDFTDWTKTTETNGAFTIDDTVKQDGSYSAKFTPISVQSAPKTATLYASADNTIRNTDNPYCLGSSTYLLVGHSGGLIKSRTLLKFNGLSDGTIPSNANITGATLSLYCTEDQSSNARTYRVYRMLKDWREGINGDRDSTWIYYNHSIGGGGQTVYLPWEVAGASGNTDREQTEIGSRNFSATETLNTWKDFALDVTAIQEMIAGGSFINNGFLIQADTENEDQYKFDSREGTNKPKLVITYTVPEYQNSLGVLTYNGVSVDEGLNYLIKGYVYTPQSTAGKYMTYLIQAKWYDSGATLLRTDILGTGNTTTGFVECEKTFLSPTSADTVKLVITLTGATGCDAPAWVDSFSISCTGISERLWIGDTGIDSTHGIYPNRFICFGDDLIATAPLTWNYNAGQQYASYWMIPAANANPNDEYTFAALLKAGVYNINLLGVTTAASPKLDWYIDGELMLSGQDWYSASTVYNVAKQISNRTISKSGLHIIKAKASATRGTDYCWGITKISIRQPTDDGSPVPTTVSFQGVAGDHTAYIITAYPTTNYGDNANLAIGLYSNGKYRSFVSFANLNDGTIPSNAIVSSATLTLTKNVNYGANPSTLSVYRVLRNWVYNQITWNIYSTGNNWETAGCEGANDYDNTVIGSIVTDPAWAQNSAHGISLDTSIIQQIIAGTLSWLGFFLRTDETLSGETHWYGNGVATASYKPKLTVTYTVPAV